MKPDADLNAVIPFGKYDHWLRLSAEVLDAIGIQTSETRISVNMSPVLELYCKGRKDGVIVKTIPLFSNALAPALIVVIEANPQAHRALMTKIKKDFGERVLFEASDYDWPDGATEILTHYNTPELVLNNGQIIKI